MSVEPINPDAEDPEDIEVDVDVDLDLISETLQREVVGDPITVRLDGMVIHILHAGAWPSSAMRAATSGDWETWARAVIEDDNEYETWLDADLKNYQIEAVFNESGRQARMSMGKSRRPSGSRKRSRKR